MPGMGRVGRLAVGIVGVLVIIAAIAYAMKPDKPVKDAGQVVGYTAPPQPIPALWIGDSYTLGTGAPSQSTGESCLTSDAMGWSCELDAIGGTDLLSPGNLAPAPRIREDQSLYTGPFSPRVVVLDLGRNNGRQPRAVVEAAVTSTLNDIHSSWPAARIVVIAPYYMNGGNLGATFAAYERSEVQRLGGVLVDPIGEGWVSKAKTGGQTISDHVHPTPAGHRYLAAHISADLKAARLPMSPLATPVTTAP